MDPTLVLGAVTAVDRTRRRFTRRTSRADRQAPPYRPSRWDRGEHR
jgi:hypothetical protein